MSPPLVVITGANSGLGFEIAKALFTRPEPYHILLGCRGDIKRAEIAIQELFKLSPQSASTADPFSVDISSDDSIAAAVKHIQDKFGYINVLVNNAGADLDTAVTAGRLTKREAWNQAWDVNVTGTHLFTEACAPLLLAPKNPSSRLLFITSGLSSITEHATGTSPRYALAPTGWPKPGTLFLGYRSTKCGLNMVATEWARVLRNDGVKVFNISPGFLNTGLGDDRGTNERREKAAMGAIDPAIGGEFCADVVEGKIDGQAWPPKVLRTSMVQPW